MQSPLGINPAAPLGAPSASDAPATDARSASDPANAVAFRSALSSANQRASSERTSRPSGPATETRLDAEEAVAAEVDSADDEAISADALAMLLTWLAPVPTTPTPVTPIVSTPAGDSDAPVTLAPASAGSDQAPTMTTLAEPLNTTGLVSGPAVQDDAGIPPTGTSSLISTDDATTSPVGVFTASQVDATLTGAVPPAAGGIVLPTDLTATSEGGPDLMPRAPLAPTSTTAPTTTTAPQPDADGQGVSASMQAAPTAPEIGAAIEALTTAATSEGASPRAAASAAPATWASLATDFGAQILAATGPATGRSAGASASPVGQTALPDDAQLPTTGSTAQAAGAGTTAGIQLPGQAVAAPGASSQATGGTVADGFEAGAEGVSAVRAGQNGADASTESSALPDAGIGMTATSGVGQAQGTSTVQTSATAAPPVTTQIADGALMAARRIGQSVEMVLQPEGLGSVLLRVTAERAGLAVHIAVDNPQARELVQASWPQLQQALEQRGLTVQSLLLDLSSGRGGDQAFQQFSGQQQFSGHQRSGFASADRRGSAGVSAVHETTPTQPGVATATRVDYRI